MTENFFFLCHTKLSLEVSSSTQDIVGMLDHWYIG